jgi:DNA mismatch endonuclease, patch repair protein
LTDTVSKAVRSSIIFRVNRENTGAELQVRSILHHLGFRFRLHRKDLPGKPDIVLPRHHTIVFVHGCFWHQHEGCRRSRRPTSSSQYWNTKLDKNRQRDRRITEQLVKSGWKVIIAWECELKNREFLSERLRKEILHVMEKR